MQLLRGDAADRAVRELTATRAGVLCLAVDPAARAGAAISALAIASPDRAVLIEPARTPSLVAVLQQDRAWGAHDAKGIHRALINTLFPRGNATTTREAPDLVGALPSRWACIKLIELLLSGGRFDDSTLEAMARRYELPPPPAPDTSLEALGLHAQALCQLLTAQVRGLKADNLTWVSRIEAAAVAPLAEMEHFGMPFDAAGWRRVTVDVETERKLLKVELEALMGRVSDKELFGAAAVNLDSDAELRKILSKLGHDVPNLRRSTLERLPAPVGPALVRYRELAKLSSAYGEAFLLHVGADARIHPSFEQIGASTGRMACHSPNLQAMVKDSPHRLCFRTQADRTLVVADYGACELRILAEMSGDPVFAEAFLRGEDLHARVATSIFGKTVSKTENPELRQRAKAINFGLVYGMSAGGLARTLELPLPQAQQLLERYFKTFPKIRTFLDGVARLALERGYAATMTGRRLYLRSAENSSDAGQAERIAKNMPIQGTSADITKIALARLRRRLAASPSAWLVNCVHDEIVVECDTADGALIAQCVSEEMVAAGAEVLRHIELAVDVHVADIWGK